MDPSLKPNFLKPRSKLLRKTFLSKTCLVYHRILFKDADSAEILSTFCVTHRRATNWVASSVENAALTIPIVFNGPEKGVLELNTATNRTTKGSEACTH